MDMCMDMCIDMCMDMPETYVQVCAKHVLGARLESACRDSPNGVPAPMALTAVPKHSIPALPPQKKTHLVEQLRCPRHLIRDLDPI